MADTAHGEGEKKPSHFTPIILAAAVLALIAFVLPMAGTGIGDFVRNIGNGVAEGAGNINSQRNSLIAIGVGAGFMIAALFGLIALGLHWMAAGTRPPAPPAPPAGGHH